MNHYGNKYRKLLAAVLSAALCLSSLWGCQAPDNAAPSTQSQTSQDTSEQAIKEQEAFQQFTNDMFAEEVRSSAITLHYNLEDPERYGISDAESPFGEASLEALQKDTSDTKAWLEKLLEFDPSLLSDDQKLTYEVLKSFLDTSLMGEGYELYSQPLAPTIGVQAQLPILLAEYTFRNRDDVTDYLSLLSQIDQYYGELETFEKQKAEAGLFYSDISIDHLIESCESYLVVPQENFLTETFNEKLEALQDVTEEEKEAWKQEHIQIIAEHFVPAYRSLIETLESLKGTGVNDKGMCGFPNGKEYYEYLAYNATYTSYASIDELTAAITERIDKDSSIVAEHLTSDLYQEMLTYSFRETEPEAILNDLQIQMKEYFPELPSCSYTVKQVPKALELTLSPAFYLVPPMDNFKENVIYINGNEAYASTPLYTTLAHEGYPGHLYQTVYFSDSCDIPIRHLLSSTAYSEGWATYVEYLSYFFDNGLSPELQTLLMHNQAVTLGVHALLDLEINYYGWDKEQTAQFLNETYGITDQETVDRMFYTMVENPSNYLSYYVGWLEIQQMREEAEQTLGPSFQAKDFHTFLLEIGPAPFSVIRSYFKSWLITYPLS